MKIIVQGKGDIRVKPDQIVMNISFQRKEKEYQEVLDRGVQQVEDFVTYILEENGFTKEQMKTTSFTICEETRYDEIMRQQVFEGYCYRQQAVLTFDYDMKRLSKLMGEIAKLSNPPHYQISFGVKDERECRRKLLKDAHQDGYYQALNIAEAAGKKLLRCEKADFQPFTTNYTSVTSYSDNCRMLGKGLGSAEFSMDTFIPEDIHLSEVLYCLWIAE